MNNRSWIIAGIIVLLGGILLPQGLYTLNEAEQAVLTQFGKPVGDAIIEPGLHFKLPFVQRVHRFDKRFLDWDGDPNDLPTRDKRFVFVDTYARWRIVNPLLFFQRLRDELGAQTRLDDILDGATRNAVANHKLVEVVRSSDRSAESSERTASESEEAPPLGAKQEPPSEEAKSGIVTTGRSQIQAEILKEAQERSKDLGIEILDVRIKRINYVRDVQEKVYERMTAERQRIADRYISEGEGEAFRIRGEKERDLNQIQSEAYRTAEEIRGKADAAAARIYADAYNRSSSRRQFYAFLKRIDLLRSSVDKNTELLLSTNGEAARLLKNNQN